MKCGRASSARPHPNAHCAIRLLSAEVSCVAWIVSRCHQTLHLLAQEVRDSYALGFQDESFRLASAWRSIMEFSAGEYRNSAGDTEWGVFSKTSRTWYFPDHNTEESACALAEQLNRGAA